VLYAKVVVGLPVEGPFDYIVPADLERIALPGCRVKVFFGPRKITGYIVGLSRKSGIKKLKSIVELLDSNPLLDKNMLSLTGELAAYYCSSWGEMIESALPEPIRQGRKVSFTAPVSQEKEKTSALPMPVLLHSLDSRLRWDFYLEKVKEALDKGKSVLLLSPDKEAAGRAAGVLSGRFSRQVSLLYRKEPNELEEWCKVRSGEASIVVGTISAVFAPMQNLGLIILEQEEDFAYKQDQVPHYHARQAAFMRSQSDKAELILGAVSPSLEAIYLCRKGKLQYRYIPPATNLPEVKTVDLRFGQGFAGKKWAVFSKYLLDAVSLSLEAKEIGRASCRERVLAMV
jgi:primosomal protein N'